MPSPVLSAVPLDSIDDGSRWNIHPFLQPVVSSLLKVSCERAGILHPPLLLEKSGGGFQLLDGRQRIALAREFLNLHQCPCLVVPATSSNQFILSMLLESQTCAAPLSPMEIAHYLKLCRQAADTAEEYACLFSRVLPGKPGGTMSKRIESLLLLEDDLQEMVHTLFLAETMALELLKLEAEDRRRLAYLFRSFGMGGGKQKRLFSLARDIAGRKGVSITKVLNQPPIRDILLHREMNEPQKVHSMLTMLQQMAAPLLTAAEESFRQRVASMDPPSYCSIQHSQSFETDEVELTIRFSNFEYLERAWPVVKEGIRRNNHQR